MRVVYIIDSITDLNKKISLLKLKFGDNINFIVRADLETLFRTYNYQPNAVYYNNLSIVLHSFLSKLNIDDTIICYSSLMIDSVLLDKFIVNIADKSTMVSLMPTYNAFEQICNSTYNIYVKSLFKTEDSLYSAKLQFLPSETVTHLIDSHIGNRLFKAFNEQSKVVYTTDKEQNKSTKTKSHPLKQILLACIIALLITVGLLSSIAYYKVSYIIILLCSILYILDIILTIIFICKSKFDRRFLK